MKSKIKITLAVLQPLPSCFLRFPVLWEQRQPPRRSLTIPFYLSNKKPTPPTYTELDPRNAKPQARFDVKASKGAPDVVIVLLLKSFLNTELVILGKIYADKQVCRSYPHLSDISVDIRTLLC